MKYLLALTVLLTSCTKTVETELIEDTPVLVQVEAVYVDGNSDLSPIVVAR